MPLRFLSGFRVVDLSQFIPGPYAAQMLADLGADVIKIEPPQGDPMRNFDPPDDDGLAFSYKLINAGKRVLQLDLKTEDGLACAEQLLAAADVLVESFRPGTLERLGLGRGRLMELNPRLVHVAISGWGQTGPYRLRAGHDLAYMAVGGGLAGSGTPEAPVMTCPPLADHAGATMAVVAVLAALIERISSGRGAYLDVSLMESALAWQAIPMTLAARGTPPERGGHMLTGAAAWYQIYRTADGRFVVLAALEAKFWSAFCTAVGRPDWIARQHEPMPQTALIGELSTLFATRSLRHWQGLLDGVDCCFEAVVEAGELADHPQVAARGQVLRRPNSAPLVEALLGLRHDDGPPPSRKPLREGNVQAVLAEWQ
ncbi:MAG: CoA transferase [Azospirillum sp.]|nr:CoA transferase [Azospirillum sp.]